MAELRSEEVPKVSTASAAQMTIVFLVLWNLLENFSGGAFKILRVGFTWLYDV